ncbi:MAG: hypothetical protein WCE69_07770 [Aestuariivirga sp.]
MAIGAGDLIRRDFRREAAGTPQFLQFQVHPRAEASVEDMLLCIDSCLQSCIDSSSRIHWGGPKVSEQYFIIFHNNEWKISFKDKHYGPYPDQEEAIEAAVEAAYAMGAIGIDAQVLVQEAENTVRTEWAYGMNFNLFER